MAMLELRNICKYYNVGGNELKVLDGFGENIEEGELIALVGPSGAGKSTLMHIAGGLDRPTRGEVIFDGKDIYALKSSELDAYRGLKVGFVFQFHYLLDDFTALENVALPGFILGADRKKTEEKARNLIDSVGLSSRTGHYPSELSGGEQQRIAVARALINSPRILLADEPTGNLDKANSTAVMDILTSLSESGVSVVVVTHDEEIARSCSRRIRLEKI